MYGHDTLFLYFTRRAQQEQVAAINASCAASATAHRTLSRLLAAKALLAASEDDGLATTGTVDERLAVAA